MIREHLEAMFIGAQQAAVLLERDDSHVRRLCESGALKGAFKLDSGQWRIPRASIEQHLRTRRRPGQYDRRRAL